MTEAKLYRTLYRHVYSVAHPRRAGVQYTDHWIVLVYLWSVLHHRPAGWACDPRNWPASELDGRPLPDDSTLSRRLREVGVPQLLERVTLAASDLFHPSGAPLVKQLDSKPLVVGGCSTDADAKRGRVADGQFAKGYRLHALTHGRVVRHWTLLPMNEHDTVAAAVLLPKLEGGGGYVVADNAYDSNGCHGLSATAGHQLVAPPRACNAGVRDAAYNRPERLRALDLLDSPLAPRPLAPRPLAPRPLAPRPPAAPAPPAPAPARGAKRGGRAKRAEAARRAKPPKRGGGPSPSPFGRDLYACRQRIESAFGGLTFEGLGPLPPWVRGPRRVALWAAAKILIYLCRSAAKAGLMA